MDPLCRETLSQMQDLGAYQVALLSCVLMLSNTSRDHSTMTSGGVNTKCGNTCKLTYSLKAEGLVRAGKISVRDHTRIWERLESPVSGLLKSFHLEIFCLRRHPLVS